MRLVNGLLTLLVFGFFMNTKPAQAVMFPDETPTTYSNSDDENQDAVSRFGSDATHVKAKKTFQALDPISEASFDHPVGSSSRSPASVVEEEPSTKSHVKIKASDKSRPKKVIISEAKRAKSYQEIAVIANDNGFFPSNIFLTQGVPVRMYVTGASAKSQCFMLDQFGVRRQIRNQHIEEVTFVPDQVGTFTFNCPMNGAKGNLIVKELDLGVVKEREPASQDVAHSEPLQAPHKDNKVSEIHDDDFTPEFRAP